MPKLVISFFLAFSLIFTFASQQRILVFIFLPYFVLLLTVYTLVGRGVQKKQKPKTEPKNHLTEKNFCFRFGYGSGGSKIQLTEPKLENFKNIKT